MRIALALLLSVVIACVAGCIWLVQVFHVDRFYGAERRTTFLIGDLDSGGLYLHLALIAAVALLGCVVITMRLSMRIVGKRKRRTTLAGLTVVLVVGLPLAGLHLLDTAVGNLATYTQIQGPTVTQDLVVREWSLLLAGGGHVFERTGSMLTLIGTTRVDDGQTPFHRGDYTAVQRDGVLTLEWEFSDQTRSRLVIGDPNMPPHPDDGLYHDYVQADRQGRD